MAGIAGLRPCHFAHAFKQSFGAPPHRYVTDRQILGQGALENPARTVTEVGIEVGFAETSSFTAMFRRMTGMTRPIIAGILARRVSAREDVVRDRNTALPYA